MKKKKAEKKRIYNKKPTLVTITSWTFPYIIVDFKNKEIFGSIDKKTTCRVWPVSEELGDLD